MRRLSLPMVLTAALAIAGCGGSAPENPPPAAATPPPSRPSIPPPPDVGAPPANATRTASGISWLIVKPGTGTIHPRATSTVRVHYTGWQTNGQMFDSSVLSGAPVEFPLDGVIPGWTEGVQLMVLGEKRRFWIPGPLAYDTDPRPDVPKGLLVFDIELLDIK